MPPLRQAYWQLAVKEQETVDLTGIVWSLTLQLIVVSAYTVNSILASIIFLEDLNDCFVCVSFGASSAKVQLSYLLVSEKNITIKRLHANIQAKVCTGDQQESVKGSQKPIKGVHPQWLTQLTLSLQK